MLFGYETKHQSSAKTVMLCSMTHRPTSPSLTPSLTSQRISTFLEEQVGRRKSPMEASHLFTYLMFCAPVLLAS